MQLVFNDINLDETIENYTTANVEGRGVFVPNINVINIEGRDGNFILSQNFPSRILIVYFVINAKNNNERLNIEHQLNKYLNTDKDVKIMFTDEDDIYYLGRISNISNIKYDYFQGMGSFELMCQNPFKYSKENTISLINNGEIVISNDGHYKYELVEISGQYVGTGDISIMDSKNNSIILSNIEQAQGSNVIITRNEIKINGMDCRKYLDINSIWKEFSIIGGRTITLKGLYNAHLKYRGLDL